METNYGLHFVLLFASIINGAFLGLVYDVFRISRLFFLNNKIVIFFEDLAFCLVCALSFIIIFYNYSNGRMRAYAFIGGIGGFCVYYFTLGRFTKSVCEHIYAFASPKIRKLNNKIRRALYNKEKQFYTYRKSLSSARNAGRGFGLLKTGGKV
jgi:spore cortex biosynthesis protein YabQ